MWVNEGRLPLNVNIYNPQFLISINKLLPIFSPPTNRKESIGVRKRKGNRHGRLDVPISRAINNNNNNSKANHSQN